MDVELVTSDDFKQLFSYFTKTSYEAKKSDAFGIAVQEKCEKLFAQDYRYSIVNNTNGELCNTYPSHIIFLEGKKAHTSTEHSEQPDEENNNINNAARFREQVSKSRMARCRTRFPVPVILLDGKYICRSSTLACGKEIYSRMSLDYLFPNEPVDADKENVNLVDEFEDVDSSASTIEPIAIEPDQNDEDSKVYEYRNHDVQLLRDLSITKICDLMVEEKKVKVVVYVTSSEKADKHKRYEEDFTILSMPYPGCEFFQKFREFDYHGEKMQFNWKQSYINRKVELPFDSITSLGIDWAQYKQWDLNTLTQNYMKILVKFITEGSSSILIHCISGWDRTPLFISMLRMSLWADGKIHCSLTALEMVYLTVGYDWFLFGHQLSCRLSKREEIMKYCFYYLKFLSSPDFSVLNLKNGSNDNSPESVLEPGEGLNFKSPHDICSNNGDVDMVKGPDVIWYPEDNFCTDPASPRRNCPASSPEKNELSGSSEDLAFIPSSAPNTLAQSREDILPSAQSRDDVLPSAQSRDDVLPSAQSGGDILPSAQSGGDVLPSVQSQENMLPSSATSVVQSTSPLAVPSSGRQRTESSSSDLSYLIISGTGSIPQMSPRSSISSPTPELNPTYHSLGSPEKCKKSTEDPPESSVHHKRKDKLNELRRIFLNTYFSAVNVGFKSGSGSGLVGLFNQCAERVGIRTPKAPA